MFRKLFLVVLAGIYVQACAQSPSTESKDPWWKKMADSDMKRNPDPTMLDFAKSPRWNYTNGLVCLAVQEVWKETRDTTYFNYGKKYADEMIDEDGSIKTYKVSDYNIDKVNSGKILFDLYAETKNAKYEKAIHVLRDQMRTHPRTSEGGFWHKNVYPHQMWLDGLYMASPFLARYAKTYNEAALFDDVALQLTLVDKYTFDSATNLFFHAWDESKQQQWADKQTGKSPHAWGRAMGWYAMALVDVLDYFPRDHKDYNKILALTEKMAKSIIGSQDPATGVWYQVMDQRDRPGNYLESSASCMFTYFLLKGLNKGYLSSQYKAKALRAYDQILDRFIENENGLTRITEVCAVAGLGGDPYRSGTFDYYINEMKRDNDPKAVGPFILMSLQYDALVKGGRR
jgi:unsaturated rhamnogalacturonyl hydrolase